MGRAKAHPVAEGEGYREISVLGMSLGSWVVGLIATHEPAVSKASLFLTAGSLVAMVWTARATRAIRDSVEPTIALTDLRRAWSPLNLGNFAHKLARPELELHVVLVTRDKVVLPELSRGFIQKLNDAGAKPEVFHLNCGLFTCHAAIHLNGRLELEEISVARQSTS